MEQGEQEEEPEQEVKPKKKRRRQRPASQRDTITIPCAEYQERTEIAAHWKEMEQRLTIASKFS